MPPISAHEVDHYLKPWLANEAANYILTHAPTLLSMHEYGNTLTLVWQDVVIRHDMANDRSHTYTLFLNLHKGGASGGGWFKNSLDETYEMHPKAYPRHGLVSELESWFIKQTVKTLCLTNPKYYNYFSTIYNERL